MPCSGVQHSTVQKEGNNVRYLVQERETKGCIYRVRSTLVLVERTPLCNDGRIDYLRVHPVRRANLGSREFTRKSRFSLRGVTQGISLSDS